MVEIEYVPYQKLIVHDIIEQDNTTFFEEVVRMALSQPVQVEPSVNWIDGIAFIVAPMPPTEDIVKENLSGKLHIASVLFTRIAFQPQVKLNVGNQGYTARMRKADNNKNFVNLAKFLKDFKASPDS